MKIIKLIKSKFSKSKKQPAVIGYTVEKTLLSIPISSPKNIMVIEPGALLSKGKKGEYKHTHLGKSLKTNKEIINNRFNRILVKLGLIEIKIEGVMYSAKEVQDIFGGESGINKLKL